MGSAWEQLEALGERLGGALRERLGAPGSSWRRLGSAWERLGSAWERLGAPGERLGAPHTCFYVSGVPQGKFEAKCCRV